MAHLYSALTVEAYVSEACSKDKRDYWNLDDILSEEEFVPCAFRFNAKGLGYLNLLESISPALTH